MNISKNILKLFGWKVKVTVPDRRKGIICVAPHTSNWDFILGELAIRSVNRKSGFLMKEAWFFFPLGYLFKAIGGIPVARKNKKGSLVDAVSEKIKNTESIHIAVTPEGTRKQNPNWHTGFLRIALQANVPIDLAYIDFEKKEIGMLDSYHPTGDMEKDIQEIKNYYKDFKGKYPNKFSI